MLSINSAVRLPEYVTGPLDYSCAYDRSCIQVWGVSIGAAILQNQLAKRLPAAFLQQILGGEKADSSNVSLVYAIIPLIPGLEEPLKHDVRQAFGEAFNVIWQVMTGILGIGLIASLFMENIPLHTYTDQKRDIQQLDKATAGSDLGQIMEQNSSTSFFKSNETIAFNVAP